MSVKSVDPATEAMMRKRDSKVMDGNLMDKIGRPDHSGWMRKKGEKYNTWKMRFFVLKGTYLYYLKSEAVRKGALLVHNPSTDEFPAGATGQGRYRLDGLSRRQRSGHPPGRVRLQAGAREGARALLRCGRANHHPDLDEGDLEGYDLPRLLG